MGRKPKVTVKEKILVHLLDHYRHVESVEVPGGMTQKGMAAAIGVPRSHIALTLGGMIEEGLVEAQKTRVVGEARRQNAYFLTVAGMDKAAKLRSFFGDMKIELAIDGESPKSYKINELRKDYKNLNLIQILACLDEELRLDPKVLSFSDKQESIQEPALAQPSEKGEDALPKPEESTKNLPRPTEKQAPEPVYRVVYCAQCKNSLTLVFSGDAGNAPCPICGQYALSDVTKQAHRLSGPLAIAMGLGLILLSMILFLVAPDELCFVYPVGAVIGFMVFALGLLKTKGTEGLARKTIMFFGAAFGLTFIAIIGIMFEDLAIEKIGYICFLCAPPLLVLCLPKPLPTKARFSASLFLAVVLSMLGFSLALGIELGGWDMYYSGLWLAFGLSAGLLSLELKKDLNVAFWPLVFFAAGAFMVCALSIIIYTSGSSFTTVQTIATGAWLALSGVLLSSLVNKGNWRERVVNGMKHGAVVSMGFGFFSFGLILTLVGKYMEGTLEIFIGVPLIWYGGKDAARLLLPSRLAIIILLAIVELSTAISLLWG